MSDGLGQLVYFFGQGRADGTAAMKDILGGKGAGLAEMTNLGMPVPAGFTIPASSCQPYLENHAVPAPAAEPGRSGAADGWRRPRAGPSGDASAPCS